MNDQSAPQIHASQRLTTPGGAQADIDVEMVPLVRALWAASLTTTACCQDFGEGTAGQREANPHSPRYGGDAFVAYYWGYAWLKMPLPDTQRLLNALLGTEFHGKVTQRWTPGSWRIHVPMIFDENRGIALDDNAQIHFPRRQIASLTLVLKRVHRNAVR